MQAGNFSLSRTLRFLSRAQFQLLCTWPQSMEAAARIVRGGIKVGSATSLFKIRPGSSTIVMHFGVASRRFCGRWPGINFASRCGSDSCCRSGREGIFRSPCRDLITRKQKTAPYTHHLANVSLRLIVCGAVIGEPATIEPTRRTADLPPAAAPLPVGALQKHDNGVVLSRLNRRREPRGWW